jgi:glycosyltransferase involved in cell wall biosynthesis
VRILQVNKFHWLKGGSERYYFDLQAELEARGHQVAVFSTRNPANRATPYEPYFVPRVDYHGKGLRKAIRLARDVIWNKDAAARLGRLLDDFRPDVAHLHNFHHQLSPSILTELSRRRIPVVQTLHDYKWVCPAYLFLSHGEVCERCGPGNRFHPVVRRRCHHDSFLRSLVVHLESSRSWGRRDFDRVARFLAPSQFMADRVIAHGLPRERVQVMPYFIRTGSYRPAESTGAEFLYAGRLSREKGLSILFDALARSEGRLRLAVAGTGPLEAELLERARDERLGVEFLGHLRAQELHDAIRRSLAVVVPSLWYENQPYAVLESFALGVPVIASDIGGLPELVREEETGSLVPPGYAAGLRDAMDRMMSDRTGARRMGFNARALIEQEFDAEHAILALERLYGEVAETRG